MEMERHREKDKDKLFDRTDLGKLVRDDCQRESFGERHERTSEYTSIWEKNVSDLK